jgi:phosphoenolpyruvate carboxykinase (ATP)
MASKASIDFYKNLKEMSSIRAVAETIMLNPKVRKVNAREAYEMAMKQPGVAVTDLEIYPPFAERLGLPKGAKVLNDCHGQIIGRTAKARVFYNRIPLLGVQLKQECSITEYLQMKKRKSKVMPGKQCINLNITI